MAEEFSFGKYAAKRRVTNASADVLLHAVVVTVRDGAGIERINELLKCYPRVLNRSNPYTVLLDEICRLRATCEEQAARLEKLESPQLIA